MAAPKKQKRIADPFASLRDPTTGRVMIPIQEVIAQQNAIAQQAALAPPPIKKHIHDQGCVDLARKYLLAKEEREEAFRKYYRVRYSRTDGSEPAVSPQQASAAYQDFVSADRKFTNASARYENFECPLVDEVYDFQNALPGMRPKLTPPLRDMFRTQRTYR